MLNNLQLHITQLASPWVSNRSEKQEVGFLFLIRFQSLSSVQKRMTFLTNKTLSLQVLLFVIDLERALVH